jgi:hypothetical protein
MILLTLLAASLLQPADAPRIVKSVPPHQSRDVRPEAGRLVVTFDRDMKTGSHSVLEVPGQTFPPVVPDGLSWPDARTFVLAFGPLKPGTSYAVQLNGERRKGFRSAAGDAPLEPSVIAFTAAAEGGASRKHPTVVFRRTWEPRQKAFSVLVPEGWRVEGGMFAVDPGQAGGALNSVDTKCDFSVKRDAAGTVMARWAPAYNFVDFSRSPEFANAAALFPPGSRYNGALVRPMPDPDAFLRDFFDRARPQASEVGGVERLPLPELADICTAMAKDVNAQLAALGKRPMTFAAGALVLDYAEGGTRYREAAATAICDFRGAAGIWSNPFTFQMRAPAAEADSWKPVLDVVRQSLKINPEWLAAYQRASGQRGEAAAEIFRTLTRIDQEIYERRARNRAEIQRENYLVLTGQEEYVNPFTKEVERDSSDFKHRWTTAGGDRLYTDADPFDPNRDPDLGRVEWKRTPPRPR